MTTFSDNIESNSDKPGIILDHLDPLERNDLMDVWNLARSAHSAEPIDRILKSDVRARLLGAISRISHGAPAADRGIFTGIRSKLLLLPRQSFAVAAVLVTLLGISFLFAPEVHVIRAPLGSATAVHFTLPDGTSGFLSAGSELRYSDTFGTKGRAVALKGEAMFNVPKNGLSFFVDTYNVRVSVLGTSFSVRSWTDDLDAGTVVKVREGRVAVARRYDEIERVQLVPAQQILVGPELPIVTRLVKPTTEQAFSWMTGGFDFVNAPIGNVLNELSRRYDVLLTAPISIRDRRITLLPSENSTLEGVLVDMSAAVNIRYRRIAGGYEFYLD